MWSSRAAAFVEEKRKFLVCAVLHQWAFVVEKRKVLALLRPWSWKKSWAFQKMVEKRKVLASLVFHQWAFVVEQRKALALLDRLDPYQHLDTDDSTYFDEYDNYFSDWPDDKFYEVVTIRLPSTAG